MPITLPLSITVPLYFFSYIFFWNFVTKLISSNCNCKGLFTEQRDVEGGEAPLHRRLEQVAVQILSAAHLVVQAGHDVAQDHPANRRHDDGSCNEISIFGLPIKVNSIWPRRENGRIVQLRFRNFI